MRNNLVVLTVAFAALASAQSAQACDMEGFGFARINPFGQHAAWNVPNDAPNPQQSENSAVLSTQAREEAKRSVAQDAATPMNAVQPSTNSAPKALAVSQSTPAEQAMRFTATKD